MDNPNFETRIIGIVENPKNKKLISNLEKQGNKIISFPEPQKKIILKDSEIFQNIDRYDWLIFTDLDTVDYFLSLMEEKKIDFFSLDALSICALGESVADRLRFQQIHTDVIPANIFGEIVFSDIENYVADELTDLSFLIIKEKNSEFEFVNLLEEDKAKIETLDIYESKFENSILVSKLKALIKGGGIDEFIFSSPEEVFTLSNYFPNEKLSEIFSEIKTIIKDEITQQTFAER